MKQCASNEFRVGIDIGGTFTDFVFVGSDGTSFTKKVLSTPDDYSRGVAEGVREALAERGISPSCIKEVVHGTTIVTNTCLELTGAKVGLITTKGFRDVLEITRGRMPQLYDLTWSRPTPLVPRYLRLEVDERIGSKGEIIQPLNVDDVMAAIDKLVAEGVEAVAVCLYNSPRNPIHEEKIGELLKERVPRLFVSLSTRIRPMMKEYERTSEVVVNAYVLPVVARYMAVLKSRLKEVGVDAPLYVMASSGGMMTVEAVAEKPIEIVECGPAAGVVGAAYLAEKAGTRNLITYDIGGTTAKASIVEDGKYTRSDEYEVAAGIHRASRLHKGKGYVLRVPSIDIAEIGAGGGSILWLDKGGLLRVGPKSSGAAPGPACYDRGGQEPTLTDCYVVLGYMNPNYLLGGDFKLNARKAHEVIASKIAEPLGMSTIGAAYGAYRIVNSDTTRAINAVSSERGRDPRKFSLVVFGGAGALHGAEVARGLGIKQVIIPPYGGIFSAFGLLCADVERYFVRAVDHVFEEAAVEDIDRTLNEMAEEALALAVGDGFDKSVVQIERFIDLRYRQQASELPIVVPEGRLDANKVRLLQKAFDEEHLKTFGHNFPGTSLEAVNLTVVSRIAIPKPPLGSLMDTTRRSSRKAPEMRKAYFGEAYGAVDTPVLNVEEIGQRPRRGPLLVDTYDTTIVVPPGCEIVFTPAGSLVINIGDQER
ncbi:MAG: hydantoinase/oxoprolinase family protein [Chloroflexota bacterium]